MSISTSIRLVNQNDSKYLAATRDNDKRVEWEDEEGNFIGSILPYETSRHCCEETDDEYGGYLIDISKLPANATHIWVFNS
jgi:hypothetical protein